MDEALSASRYPVAAAGAAATCGEKQQRKKQKGGGGVQSKQDGGQRMNPTKKSDNKRKTAPGTAGQGAATETSNRSPPKKKQAKAKKKKKTKKQPEEEIEWKVKIQKEYIARLPVIAWEGTVKLLTTEQQMIEAVKEILDSGEKHLGFDTETRPNFIKGAANRHRPALVQLATSDSVYLFRICKLPGHRFDPLHSIFTVASIMKTGVSIHEDVRDLQQVQNFAAAGFVDCVSVTREHPLRIHNAGLRALTAHFLQGRITKGAAQMSNWACETLSAKQIRYAATDAWVSREVHLRAVAAAAEAVAAAQPPQQQKVASNQGAA